MIPQDWRKLDVGGLSKVGRISRGFYISECLKVRP
jgi:magnesium-protoporphyrin O-methyltransferase